MRKQPANYFEWHYVFVPKKIIRATVNTLIFLTHFFSVGLLIRTFLSPWKRQLVKKKGAGFSFKDLFEILTFNLISRTMGAIARLTLIFAWLALEVVTLPIGVFVFLIWLFLPGLSFPFYLIFKEKKDKAQALVTKKPLHPQKLLAGLAQTPMGKFVLARLGLAIEKIKSLPCGEAEAKKFKTLIPTQITSKDLFELLAKNFAAFNQILAEAKLKPVDVGHVCDWYLRETERFKQQTDFFKLENLLKTPPLGKNLAFGYTPTLDRYCTDLTSPQPFYHHLVGRKKETSLIEQILCRTSGNNVLLVGEPGVGRNTIVMEFAKKVKEGRVNPTLAHKRVLSFGIRKLLAESKSTMEAKGIVEDVLEEAAYAGNIILSIDEFDHYVSTGPGRIDLTNVFAKAVTKGLQIIGITTSQDFAKYLYPNQALLKEFEKVEATPPTKKQALMILENTVGLYEKQNNVFVTYHALKEIIDKVDKYVIHIPFPEKAIDLLDETCVYASQKGKTIITSQDIIQVISEKTKIPLGDIKEEESEKLKNLEKVIHQRIINQEKAVVAIAKAMRRARTGIAKTGQPIGSFLFMGPTGVGKTETAKALAEGYFGSEKRMVRFDMSEYQGPDAIERVIGSVKTNQPGLFAKTLRENPFSLLLLDEIEKAHPNILNIFLVMFDEGYFTDAFGKKVDCRNLIIIGTSNAGTEFIRQKINQGVAGDKLDQIVLNYVQKQGIFSPEFINRFDAVVVYRPLTHKHLIEIAKLMLKRLNQRLAKKEISVKITDELVEKIVKLGYEPAFGARPMNRVIQDKVEDQIAQKILRAEVKKGEEIEIKI